MKQSYALLIIILALVSCEKKRLVPRHESLGARSGGPAEPLQHESTQMPEAPAPSKLDETQSGPLSVSEQLKESNARTRQPGEVYYELARETSQFGTAEQVLNLYLSSCGHGYLPGCHRYGWILERKGNAKGALNFYERACEGKVWKSCNNLGFHYEKRNNLEKARDYYSRACLGNHKTSCANLQRIHKATPDEYKTH
jgi:TPR repeat protein